LADSIDDNFPFYKEIRDVLNGVKVEYDDSYAEDLVEEFMGRLKPCDVAQILV
jgi:hypothetical protein